MNSKFLGIVVVVIFVAVFLFCNVSIMLSDTLITYIDFLLRVVYDEEQLLFPFLISLQSVSVTILLSAAYHCRRDPRPKKEKLVIQI